MRQTKTNMDKLEESIVDDVWDVDANRTLSGSWSGSTCSVSSVDAHQKVFFSWRYGRVTKNTSHIAGSIVVNVQKC